MGAIFQDVRYAWRQMRRVPGFASTPSQAIAALLFGVSRFDPLTHFGVIVLLASVSMVARGLPAWRAAKVGPVVALRYE